MRLPRALAAVALTLGLVAAGSPAAQADSSQAPTANTCQFSSGSLSQEEMSIGAEEVVSLFVYVTATGCGSLDARPRIQFNHAGSDYLYSEDGGETNLVGKIQIDPSELSNSDAGKRLRGIIFLPGGTTRSFPGPTLTLKREALIPDAYAPTKVKKN